MRALSVDTPPQTKHGARICSFTYSNCLKENGFYGTPQGSVLMFAIMIHEIFYGIIVKSLFPDDRIRQEH